MVSKNTICLWCDGTALEADVLPQAATLELAPKARQDLIAILRCTSET